MPEVTAYKFAAYDGTPFDDKKLAVDYEKRLMLQEIGIIDSVLAEHMVASAAPIVANIRMVHNILHWDGVRKKPTERKRPAAKKDADAAQN